MASESPKVYLDQMFRLEVALALRDAGYDVMRASEVGQSRADDAQILQKAVNDNSTPDGVSGEDAPFMVVGRDSAAGIRPAQLMDAWGIAEMTHHVARG